MPGALLGAKGGRGGVLVTRSGSTISSYHYFTGAVGIVRSLILILNGRLIYIDHHG